uniref:Gamma-tubulin complex component n=1 Tax=Anopheles coluzzii TaxID=1518534 RepID=A0A8W7NYR9_ANOCL
MHSDSVYRLVDELVEAIGQECGARADGKTVKKCKSRAFGILLGKPDHRPPSARAGASVSECPVAPAPADPLAMLECHQFEMQMTARYKYQMVRCERFERLLDQIRRDTGGEWPLAESDCSLLLFLLSLKNSTTDRGDVLAENPFFGHSKMPAARYGPYPIFRPEDFHIDGRLVAACYDRKANPYLFRATNGVFTANIAHILANESTRNDPLAADCSYFSDKMASLNHYQGPFRYNLLRAVRQTTNGEPPYELVTNFEIVPAGKPAKPVEESLIFGMNWENLGQQYVPEEKPFVSECAGALFRFTAVQESAMGHALSEKKVVSRANFIRDIKFLITGVSSSLFHFDERNRFRALPNITIEDVRIESIQSFVEQALEIGTCFRRLLMMTRKNPYTLELIMEGFVFRAFCESVENFLCCYRVLVNSYAGESILQLLQMLSPANEQLLSMAKLCSLHPGNESDREFPTGSMLLDHLYRELIQVTQPSVSVFLLSTLRRCCLEYFAIFQRWLFQGQLHDPSGELFVFFVDHYRSNTKHFFDKAYFIRRKSVPGFLKGYDEDILLCGKYVMLLRAFRPLHPLFTLRHPELTVCLSFAEIQTMRTQWLRYVAKARQLCGPAVSVRELYETKQSEQVEFYRLVEENFRTYMDAWRIMSQEYNLLTDEAVWDGTGGRDPNQKRTMYLNLDSDRARNRRRILESEFDIATGVENFPASPMSVDSDTVDESASPSVAMTASGTTPTIAGEQDVNANPVAGKGAGLKLDVLAAADAAERFGIERRFGIPDTAALELETPASAMKATGEVGDALDGGFDFTRAKALERREGPSGCNSLVPVAASGVAVELTEEEDDEIYREFVAAMKQQNDTSAHVGASKALEKELNSVDVLTITRFLQYSLVIPLKAHMEIVNNEILKMYLYDLDVLGHFESLRNYFLLMDGEFSTHICDNLFQRLETVRTPEELLNYQTLHSILDGALYSSNAGTDRNADRLSFIVCQVPEKFDLYSPNVFSMLNLSYRVEWPLNLIFSNETIEQYTNVFKYLVKVRRVSYVLEDSFQLLKEASRRLGKPLLHSPQYARVQLIRHKLSHLVNALKNYITSSALHASWETFREDLQDATETMEDLFRKHRTYLKRVIFLCLLNRRSIEFYNNIEQIFRVVLRFYRHLRSKEWRLQEESQQYYVHPRYRSMLDDEIDFEKLIKYTIFLGNKMYDHGYQKEISEFLHVININGYYDDVKPAAS